MIIHLVGLISCIYITNSYSFSILPLRYHQKSSLFLKSSEQYNNALESSSTPKNPKDIESSRIKKQMIILPALSLLNLVSRPQKVSAIGSLFEFREQSIVLQDVSFNVPQNTLDAEMLKALFVDKCSMLRSSPETIVVGFGPDSFSQPVTFIPGVSSFGQYGGHATITLNSKKLSDDTVELFERGNGLQYIKIGAEDIRLSKAIQSGASIKYAYGWVDLDTPGNIPLEVVVGSTRDPIMLVCLRVSDIQTSVRFFSEQLGMKQLPFPLCRLPGSAFEPTCPKDAVYLGYSADSMGVLLRPSAKGEAPLQVGSLLNGFTLVVDDSNKSALPTALSAALGEASRTILSPDGYPFIVKAFSQFKVESTSAA